ncbi:MAG: hypothetical protein JW820_14575 [Spirochaetales bacterium]|nr:hypothetical protein [Spirochaetales bacterium]
MNRNKTRTIALLSAAALLGAVTALAPPVAAEGVEHSTTFSVDGAYYLPDHKGYGLEDGGFAPITYAIQEPTYTPPAPDEGRDLGSTWGPAEIQAKLRHRIKVPFLAGSGSLTSGNNVAFSGTAALTPVSARLEFESVLTPIAFLNAYAGGMIGTGWNIGLFDGLGKIEEGSGIADPGSFEGVVVKPWIGGTFQFDLAALVPGEWTHVVTVASGELRYAWFSGAARGDAWMWEADIGENFNGWKLLGSFFLGYQMPLVLDTVGVLLETEQHLGYVADLSPLAESGWGSDFVLLTLSSVMNFALSQRSSLAFLVQFRRERLYTPGTIFNAYYATREYAGTYWDLYRVAFSYSLKL